jgi:hypothetical protein
VGPAPVGRRGGLRGCSAADLGGFG